MEQALIIFTLFTTTPSLRCMGPYDPATAQAKMAQMQTQQRAKRSPTKTAGVFKSSMGEPMLVLSTEPRYSHLLPICKP